MTKTHSTFIRNAAVAAFAASVAGALVRDQIASALVARGDELLYRSSVAASIAYYRRAVTIAPSSAAAVDRLAFAATLLRDRNSLQEAAISTSRYLEEHPADDAIRADRAFVLRLLGQYARAAGDFAIAGTRRHDPRLLALAGYSELRAGDRRSARRDWIEALAVDASFRPAALALARH
ncbi:MAG: hypothetical protein ACLQPV_06825 [Vulcanimicrobiaceae bacterium]